MLTNPLHQDSFLKQVFLLLNARAMLKVQACEVNRYLKDWLHAVGHIKISSSCRLSKGNTTGLPTQALTTYNKAVSN